ncbi:MAG: hypothetical protein JW910_12960 [Anaerolineae bacterium]|nr:hypothetical protein [Anaerolineae bacterium]
MVIRDQAAAWAQRALAGAALLLCSEVIWWSHDPAHYSPTQWIGLALLYLVFGALALDLLARFGVSDWRGALPVAGVYGLLHGALIGGDFAAVQFSMVTRPLGLHTLGGGVLGLLLAFWLLDGRGFLWWRAAILAWIGLAAGMWIRRFPLLESTPFAPPALAAVALYLAVGLLLLGGLRWLVRLAATRRMVSLRLHNWELGVLTAILVVAFFSSGGQGAITSLGGAVLGLLLGYLVVVLYFQRDTRRAVLVDRLRPPASPAWVAYAVYALALLLPVIFGYSLPGEAADDLVLQVMLAVFTVFSVTWLPALSIWLGFRAYVRLFREEG